MSSEEEPDEPVIQAEVRIDDTVVMPADSAEGRPPVESHVHVYVGGRRRDLPAP